MVLWLCLDSVPSDGSGLAWPRRAGLGTASMGEEPDPRAPRDVIVSSICWCLSPAPQMCCQPYEQGGEGVCDIGPSNVPHVHVALQDTGLGAGSPQTPFHQHCCSLPLQGHQAHREPCPGLTALCLAASAAPTMLCCSPGIIPPVPPPPSKLFS